MRRQQRMVVRTMREVHPREFTLTFRLQHRGRPLVVLLGLFADLALLLFPWVVGVVTLVRLMAGG